MSTYAIGDIQGCFLTLQKLLEKIGFKAERDRVWLLGDLVNRGPNSLEVLRWCLNQGSSVQAVLGNHDLHLLARAAGIDTPKTRDTLDAILEAPDREALLNWLRQRPLFFREGDHAMVHGGLAPEWSLKQAAELAVEVETELKAGELQSLFTAMKAGRPKRWKDSLSGAERLSSIAHIFTRIRLCREEGRLDFEFKGSPETAPPETYPWFEAELRREDSARLLFGHWAALGLRLGKTWACLDSGCVWGKSLSALRLEDGAVFQEPCLDLLAK